MELKNRGNEIFEQKIDLEQRGQADLTEEEVRRLNVQRTSATTMEPCDLLYINKLDSMLIICQGMQEKSFVDRLEFL